jgi:DNA-binding transcriptional MerR regulator
MPSKGDGDRLSLREAADTMNVTPGTIRSYIRAGKLKAVQVPSKYGPAYEIRGSVLKAFAATKGMEIDVEKAQETSPGQTMGAPVSAEVAELQHRLDVALAEVNTFKALTEKAGEASAHVEELLKERIAELRNDLDAAQTKADEAAAELAKVRSRGWWARTFGGAG